jgi:2,3-bisphosphoglycerate-independent phosphoglycerate mutase
LACQFIFWKNEFDGNEKPRYKKTMSFIFIFLDGVGVGRDGENNPFAIAGCRHLPFHDGPGGLILPDCTPVASIRADAGIPGTPQSATCQTALFTGHHGPELGLEHRRAYPGQRLRRLIMQSGLLMQLGRAGWNAVFLNAYPLHHELFEPPHLRLDNEGMLYFSEAFPVRFRRLLSVSTCLMLGAGQAPFGEADLHTGRSLYQDFSNRSLIAAGLALPEFSPRQAAGILADAAGRYDFVLYEYFQTDLHAHRAPLDRCLEIVSGLDQLVAGLLERLDPGVDTLLLTSDHGNLEDLSHRRHTANPVPLLAWGLHGEALRRRVTAIEEVTPALLELAGLVNPPALPL